MATKKAAATTKAPAKKAAAKKAVAKKATAKKQAGILTTSHGFPVPGLIISPLTTSHLFSLQFSSTTHTIAVKAGEKGAWIVSFKEL